MTERHFQALAWELARERPDQTEDPRAYDAWIRCCLAVALVAREANPRFDRERFLDACRGTATVKDGARHMVDECGRKFATRPR